MWKSFTPKIAYKTPEKSRYCADKNQIRQYAQSLRVKFVTVRQAQSDLYRKSKSFEKCESSFMNLDSKVIIWYNYYVIDPCAVLYIISKYGVFTAENE